MDRRKKRNVMVVGAISFKVKLPKKESETNIQSVRIARVMNYTSQNTNQNIPEP